MRTGPEEVPRERRPGGVRPVRTDGPGVTERCREPLDCPKARDPGGVSWWDGCFCYRFAAEAARSAR